VAKLKRVSLQNPVKAEVEKEVLTVDKLSQYLVVAPAKFKVNWVLAFYLMKQTQLNDYINNYYIVFSEIIIIEKYFCMF